MNIIRWLVVLLRLGATVLAGLLGGLLFGRAWLGVALALAWYLTIQLVQLGRVLAWLRTDRADLAPEAAGAWGELIGRVMRLFRRRRFHKQRLLRLLRELRRSTAAMPDGVVVLNPQAEILWFNRTAGRLLGLRGRSDIGLRIENLLRQPEFIRYMRQHRNEPPVTISGRAGGGQQLSVQIVPYGAGQLLMLVRDVTQAARLEAMRKDFVANASHELRTPLTVISGYLETLAGDPGVDPALAGPLREMQRQALRMGSILADLLELSRLEASDRPVQGRPLDVAALMAQLRQDVLARSSHLERVEVQADSRQRLLGEESQIHSAFANLVNNAANYTPAGGVVSLRWWSDERGGHFAVKDTGIGIAAEHIPRLTERFYRVDAGRSRATGGSGLGLAIVKHALQRHGAQLQILSREGLGSEFICHFPPERLGHD